MGNAMNNDLVSVIIPTYNRALRCKAAVESVLMQTHGNVEIVVVDDGSRDNTREVIYGMHERVKYIYQANGGVSAARNTGLHAATGDYIAFLDSDDSWLPWKLEAQLCALRAFPDAGMVWTDMLAVDEYGTRLHESYLTTMYDAYAYFDRETHFKVNRPIADLWAGCPTEYAKKKCYSGNIFSWMFMGNLVHTSTALLRRDRQKKVGLFDIDLIKSGEDYDYHFRTCREGDVAYIDVPSIRYQVGAADQLTQPKYMGSIALNNLKTVTRMYARAHAEIDLPEWMIKERLSESYKWVGMIELLNKQGASTQYILKSLQYNIRQPKLYLLLLLSFCPAKAVDISMALYKRVKGISATSP